MRHTKSRRARRRKPHTLLLLLAVPTICLTPGDTGAKTQRSAHHPRNPTYSLHLFIPYAHNKVHIYIYTTRARRAHTAQTYTHKHTHTIQIILYTQIHIYIIIIYTYTNMHIYIIVIHVHVNAHISILLYIIILLSKTTAAQNEVALGYHRLRGLYFPAVVSVTIICSKIKSKFKTKNLYTIHYVQISQSILVLLFITPSM